MVCMSAISMMFVKIMSAVCIFTELIPLCTLDIIISGYGGLSESRLCVFRELCPFSFLVVGECLSVLL